MVAYVGHVVRRGLEQASGMSLFKRGDGQGPVPVEIPTWGAFILVGTVIIFVLVASSVGNSRAGCNPSALQLTILLLRLTTD